MFNTLDKMTPLSRFWVTQWFLEVGEKEWIEPSIYAHKDGDVDFLWINNDREMLLTLTSKKDNNEIIYHFTDWSSSDTEVDFPFYVNLYKKEHRFLVWDWFKCK